jgi:hypothetical protein
MYWFLVILLLLLLFQSTREPFSIRVESDMDFSGMRHSIFSASEIIRDYTVRPVYRGIVDMIPFKPQYRKLRRQFR